MTALFSWLTPKNRTVFGCLLILLGIFYAYAQVGGHRFIEFDDGLYAFDNRKLIAGFNWENFVWAFTNVDAVNWHPLTWLSLFMDRELFGPRPGGYLLMNVAWHSLASCLCYIAFKKTTGSHFIGLTIGLIFALHPANVENVAWLSSRKSILDAGFWFLGIIFYVRLLQTKRRIYYLLVFLTHLLGLMCKSMHVTFPCTLWLVHALYYASLHREELAGKSWRTEIKTAILYSSPMLIVSAYFSIITFSAQTPAMSSIDYMSVTNRLINSTMSYERYVRMFFYPNEFAPFYPLFVDEIKLNDVFFPLITLVLISALCLLSFRREPNFLIGWLWFLGTMIPVIGLVQVGSQSHADRYLYIPGIGLALAMTSFFKLLPHRSFYKRGLIGIWLVGLTISLTLATRIQAAYWKDGVTLFRHSLSITGDCLTSVNALSGAYARQYRYAEGMSFLKEKIAISKNPLNKAHLLTQYAGMAMANGENADALAHLKQAIALGSVQHRTYFLAAVMSLDIGDIKSAEQYFSILKRIPTTYGNNISVDSMFLKIGIEQLESQIQAVEAERDYRIE